MYESRRLHISKTWTHVFVYFFILNSEKKNQKELKEKRIEIGDEYFTRRAMNRFISR